MPKKYPASKLKKHFVDKGYRGHQVPECDVIISRKRGNLSWREWKEMSRRQAIEPYIGHMKSDGKLGLNYLKGQLGDQLNALLSAIGHNGRLIINYLKSINPKIQFA